MSIETANPYLMPEPALVSFSGGRTSGYMLWHILQAHSGKLPQHVRVAFMNTGKECPETLDFVKECGERWGVEVVWLEYDRIDHPSWVFGMQLLDLLQLGVPLPALELPRYQQIARVVNYETASRNGEPFMKLIAARSYLPNVVTRFCTVEMKVRTAKRYMQSLGYEKWTNAVGIRADEPGRLVGKGDEGQRWTRVCPLADAGVCEEDVMEFWAAQPFDLQLRQDEGNCDLCFLKGRKKLKRLILEKPEKADWWIEQEQKIRTRAASAQLAKFNKDRSYTELRAAVFSLPLLEEPAGVCEMDEVEDCHCTD